MNLYEQLAKRLGLIIILGLVSGCSLHQTTDNWTKATTSFGKATDNLSKAADDWLASVKPFATVVAFAEEADKSDPGPSKGKLDSRAFEHFFGKTVSSRLSESDKQIAFTTQLASLEMNGSGKSLAWIGKGRKAKGHVTPGPVYTVNGDVCRRYRHIINMSGELQNIQRTACKSVKRGWRVVG